MILNFKKKADELQASIDLKANQADLDKLRTDLQGNINDLDVKTDNHGILGNFLGNMFK